MRRPCCSRSAPKSPPAAAMTSAGWKHGYHWPVAHREGLPDLSGGEAAYYQGVQEFNAQSRNIKVVFINQFGFEQKLCGKRMPADMEFMDIRKGSDVEFGQSIYEPFGIAQVEPISFGGICVFTNICGCAGFVEKAAGGSRRPTSSSPITPTCQASDLRPEQLLNIGKVERDQIEDTVAKSGGGRVDRAPAAHAGGVRPIHRPRLRAGPENELGSGRPGVCRAGNQAGEQDPRAEANRMMQVKLLDLQGQYLPLRNEIRRAIDEVCDAQSLILGPHVERFEQNLAAYCGTKHAIGVSSGTDALLCSLMALGIAPGDEVICPVLHVFCHRRVRCTAWGDAGLRRDRTAHASTSIRSRSRQKSRRKPGRFSRCICSARPRTWRRSTPSRPSTASK